MANPTDMFTEEELEQGIRNFEAVRNLCVVMKGGLHPQDLMRGHFDAVIKFCNQKVAEGLRLLRGEAPPEPSRIIRVTK